MTTFVVVVVVHVHSLDALLGLAFCALVVRSIDIFVMFCNLMNSTDVLRSTFVVCYTLTLKRKRIVIDPARLRVTLEIYRARFSASFVLFVVAK